MSKLYIDKSKRDVEGFWLPADRVWSLIFMLLINLLVYFPPQYIGTLYPRLDISTALDQSITVNPVWVYPYVAAYFFWGLCYIAMAHYENWYNVLSAELSAKLICGLFFVLMPTTVVRGDVEGSTLAGQILLLLYRLDRPCNLFPSIHCMDSLICGYCVFRKKSLHPALRWFCVILTVLICISVVKTGQHVVVDIFSGVGLAYLMLYVSRKKGWGSWIQNKMQGFSLIFEGGK